MVSRIRERDEQLSYEEAGAEIRVAPKALIDAAVTEIMEYFKDFRSSGISLAEYEGRYIAVGILRRVTGCPDPEDSR